MADSPKTVPTGVDVDAFVAAVPHARRRRDAERLVALYREVTGEEPVMWGPSIVGFGSYHYRYASGREGDIGAAGFSPRKAAAVLYFPDGAEVYAELLDRAGPHTRSLTCVYVKDLDAMDLGLLGEAIRHSYAALTADGTGTLLTSPATATPEG